MRSCKRTVENAHIRTGVLTKSRHGRDVELLQIGQAGPDVQAVLVTGRHHAAETIASHVLEGFLQEAMSDSPAGEAFRKRYVLFAVPFVDKDGVEEGDQGKNRKPHDHNRDYGESSIYPEVQAIKELDRAQNFRFALDFHCPMLTLADHQVMYFVGQRSIRSTTSRTSRSSPAGLRRGCRKRLRPDRWSGCAMTLPSTLIQLGC